MLVVPAKREEWVRIGLSHVKWAVRDGRIVLIVDPADPTIPVDRQFSEHPSAMQHDWPGDEPEVCRARLRDARTKL